MCVPEVLVIVVALAKLSLHLFRELLDDDVDVLTKRVIIVNTTGYLSHTLQRRKRKRIEDNLTNTCAFIVHKL